MTSATYLGDEYRRNLAASGLTIYDGIDPENSSLWIPSDTLEQLIARAVVGLAVGGLPLRTRSKVVKRAVCEALGYPVPESFRRTRPRFLGQRFDIYLQKADNLQIWNDEVTADRRYVVIRIGEAGTILRVRVVGGDVLASLDRTGTLTQKFQARYSRRAAIAERGERDTTRVSALVGSGHRVRGGSPTEDPKEGDLLPLAVVRGLLDQLVGVGFEDSGAVSDRLRGSRLHELVCQRLGYGEYRDDGRFPDIRHQLLEVKLQTSPTIDLGLVSPNSTERLDMGQVGGRVLRHCDVRYAVIGGVIRGSRVRLDAVDVVTGERFYRRFPQFQGKVVNKKLQIPLPAGFFGS